MSDTVARANYAAGKVVYKVRRTADKKFVLAYYDGAAPASSLVLGEPVVIVPAVGSAANDYGGYKIIAAATCAFGQVVGIVTKPMTAAGYVEVLVEGKFENAQITYSASMSAGGESLKLINGGTTLVYDAAAGTITAKTMAVTLMIPAANATTCDVFLPGIPYIVAAS
jgi:hypothetical protein